MSTKKYAVIGHPIGHSLSPFIHEKLFALDNIDASYIAIDIEDINAEYDSKLRVLDGYNVTIPHKQNIITKLDQISDKALLCNSVNTVRNTDKAEGFTTDGYGFLSAVKSKCNNTLPKNIMIFGYGGAARAIAFECIAHGSDVCFAVRKKSITNAQMLVDEIAYKTGAKAQVFSVCDIPQDINIDLVVNATPVGMYPHTDACVVPDTVIKRASAVFDSVYNPLETRLLKKAKDMNKITIGSIDMLVYQAAKAHEIWVGATYCDSDLVKICELTADKLR